MENQKTDSPRKLVLGSMPAGAMPAQSIAAGPWCFAGQEDRFPNWETTFEIAPDPFADRDLEDEAIRQAGCLACDIIPAMAKELAPDSHLPAVYWETLLITCTNTMAKQLVERMARINDLIRRYGSQPLEVVLLPEDCVFDFATDADTAQRGCMSPEWNHWIFSCLLRPVLPAAWKAVEAPRIERHYPDSHPAGLKAQLKAFIWAQLLKLPFPRLRGMSLGRTLRFSAALLHDSHGPDMSRSLAAFTSEKIGHAPAISVDPLPLFMKFLPRSVTTLTHPATVTPLSHPRVHAASILLYEDASYRQKLAIWRARGGRLLAVQHGGNYGQMRRICAMELVEYTQHAFGTWGWTSYDSAFGDAAGHGRYLPLPIPLLAGEKDTWKPVSDDIIFVGTEMSTFCYQLDSHPMPLQNIRYRARKEELLRALPEDIRSHISYRPYFDLPGTLTEFDWIHQRFPEIPRCTGPLGPRIAGCRLLVLDHHGTTLLEAMAADIPTICCWSLEHWPVTPAFEAMLRRMEKLGIWSDNPATAAAFITRVWPDTATWWHSAPVQALRNDFIRSYALCDPASVDGAWTTALKAL